jgi:hypothetical protein
VHTGIYALPDITRSDAGIVTVTVSQWESPCAADELARLDDLIGTWTLTPTNGLLSFTCLAGTSGIKDFVPRSDTKTTTPTSAQLRSG